MHSELEGAIMTRFGLLQEDQVILNDFVTLLRKFIAAKKFQSRGLDGLD